MNDYLKSVLADVICPFANKAEYTTRKIELFSQIGLVGDDFRVFTGNLSPYDKNAFLVEVSSGLYGSSIFSLGSILHSLIVNSAQEKNLPVVYSRIESPDWRLVIGGVDYFCVVVSKLYSRSHPRYHPGHTLILFQPEQLFTASGITTSNARSKCTRSVEQSFAEHGRRYFPHHSLGTPKSLRFLLDEDGKGVRWWLMPTIQ